MLIVHLYILVSVVNETGALAGISAAEAARRLGVKKETVYAYASRGMLTSRRADRRRETSFDPGEVERLAARQRSGAGRAGRLEVVVDSSLTALDPAGSLSYRGWDAMDASRSALFEQVAMWLWSGTGADIEEASALFQAPPELLAPAKTALASCPGTAAPLDMCLVALAAAAAADPYKHNRDPHGVAQRAGRMIAVVVESLPLLGRETSDRPTIAERLWSRLTASAPTPEKVRALNAALVLLADHELATSTLAARVAASTWADIYRVVMAGMATLGGPLHGGVGDRAVSLVREAVRSGTASALGARMRAGEQLPGFGHVVYRERDPRGDALLQILRETWPGSEVVRAAGAVAAAVADEQPAAFPNIDLAVATLVAAGEMIDGAAEAIFATARMAGWVAHGMEEYGHALRFRTRAAYTGPEPGSVARPIGTTRSG